jgi:alpha-mannosidase
MFDHLTTLLPCRSLQELSLERRDDEAGELLAAWTAAWHPALIAFTHAAPHWAPAETPPENPAGHVIFLPPCCEPLLPGEWLAAAEAVGACILRSTPAREPLIAAALARLTPQPPAIDGELAADFFALGYCHFVTELFTHQLRYTSNLDEGSLTQELLAAAEAASHGDAAEARRRLQAAFDLLQASREYYYGGQATLLDLTLVAATTLGPSLRAELAAATPATAKNLLLSAEVLAEMARREPESLAALQKAFHDGTVAILGGEYRERELPLLPPEAIRHEIFRGLAVYQEYLGARPTTFARRRFGLTPALPQILRQLGFTGALHATLDDGRFPASNQGRISWEGVDGTALDTLGRIPRDAARAATFWALSQSLAGAMEMDQSAAAVLAHWPQRSSPWCRDLLRATAYTGCLGKLDTLEHHFQQTFMTGQHVQYKADEYRSPYLQQAVAQGRGDPISSWVRYYHRRATADAAATFDALAALVQGGLPAENDLLAEVEQSCGAAESSPLTPREDQGEGDCSATVPSLNDRLAAHLEQAIARLAATVTPKGAAELGLLVLNPLSFARQTPMLPSAAAEVVSTPVLAEVPSLGFAWQANEPAPTAPTAPRKRGLFGGREPAERPVAEERPGTPASKRQAAAPPQCMLRNEFCEIAIDPYTGAIRSIFDFHSRGPRLSQQIALRLPAAGGESSEQAYSIMAADSVVIASASPVCGAVVSRGRLMDRQGQRAAGFQQTTRLWRGSRIVEIEIELDPVTLPGDDPWNSYYAVRWAWSDEAASLYRSVNMARVPTDIPQLESPLLVDISAEKTRTSLLMAGLPYHRRRGLRQLDTLLVVQGETARRFRLAIGIDLPAAMPAALAMLTPACVARDTPAPASPSAWLFHLDARNVVATHWEAVPDADGRRAAGFRVRLLETDGRGIEVDLRCFRAVRAARKMGVGDDADLTLPVQGDRVSIELGPYEWAEIVAEF